MKTKVTPTLLDQVLPEYQFGHLHNITLAATPERVFEIIKILTPTDASPLIHVLFTVRALPSLLHGQTGHAFESIAPLIEQGIGAGFVRLAEDPGRELLLGTVGRFWHPLGDVELKPSSVEAFCRFSKPNTAKAAMNFLVRDAGGGVVELTTETRVFAPTPSTYWKFRAYWLLIAPGSIVIRTKLLRAVQRRLEQPESSAPPRRGLARIVRRVLLGRSHRSRNEDSARGQ